MSTQAPGGETVRCESCNEVFNIDELDENMICEDCANDTDDEDEDEEEE